MKEDELREAAICGICNKKIGASGIPLFWRVRMERYGLNAKNIKSQDGLAAFFDGHAAIARVMGTDADMADKISSKEITVCETCASKEISIYMIAMED